MSDPESVLDEIAEGMSVVVSAAQDIPLIAAFVVENSFRYWVSLQKPRLASPSFCMCADLLITTGGRITWSERDLLVQSGSDSNSGFQTPDLQESLALVTKLRSVEPAERVSESESDAISDLPEELKEFTKGLNAFRPSLRGWLIAYEYLPLEGEDSDDEEDLFGKDDPVRWVYWGETDSAEYPLLQLVYLLLKHPGPIDDEWLEQCDQHQGFLRDLFCSELNK